MSGLNAHGFSRAAPCRNLRLARQIRLVLPAHKDRKQTNRAILSIYYFDNEQLERAWFFGQGTLASQLATRLATRRSSLVTMTIWDRL